MTNHLANDEWTDANQRLMVAEFARIKHRLGVEADAQALSAAVQAAQAAMPYPAAIDHLVECFGLSAFERDILLLCAGVEMDAQVAARCELASSEPRRPGATFGLALAAFEEPHWSALTPIRPLRRWRLVEVDEAGGLTRGRLRIDERVLHYLAGVNYLDVRLRTLLHPAVEAAELANPHQAVCQAACERIESHTSAPAAMIWLTGDDPSGQADVAAQVAERRGVALQVLRVEDVPANQGEIEALATLWEREAVLLDSALMLVGGDDVLPNNAIRFVEQIRGLVFVCASQAQPVERSSYRFIVNKPDANEQKRLWQQALGASATRLNGSLDGVAGQFKLSARAIRAEADQLASRLAGSDQPDNDMWAACRAMGRTKLDELAQRMECKAHWDDLVLPSAQKETLKRIGAHLRSRLKVHLDWGFADKGTRGLGVSALFAGESGTGKTMAAEVLARELQLDLYRIDLSAVVNKYIGETEKNLRRVFDAAEDSGAILLFDEADALFGKRSEVKDSHDRYANIEVSYLLQRMEAYRGLAILTTNLKNSLDTAFQRRLTFVVQFPFPDLAQREAIWRRVFPERTPISAVDYGKLARLNVTGGNIRNIAISAAFRAAEAGSDVVMAHLLHAAHSEGGKRERPVSDAETRGWV
jgi:hypothetical protein